MKKSRETGNNNSPYERVAAKSVWARFKRHANQHRFGFIYQYIFLFIVFSAIYLLFYQHDPIKGLFPGSASMIDSRINPDSFFGYTIHSPFISNMAGAFFLAIPAMIIFLFAELYRHFISKGETSLAFWALMFIGWIPFLPMAVHLLQSFLMISLPIIMLGLSIGALDFALGYLTNDEVSIVKPVKDYIKKIRRKHKPLSKVERIREEIRLKDAMRLLPSEEDVLESLVYGIDINLRDEKGNSALINKVHSATGVDMDAYKVVKLLCKKGADVNLMNYAGKKKNIPGETALYCAAREGYGNAAKVLLEYGAKHDTLAGDEDRYDVPKGGTLPLIIAAQNNHAPIVELLVENGADVDGRDSEGSTALMELCSLRHEGFAGNKIPDKKKYRYRLERTVPMLLSLGANINAEDSRGRTALKIAVDGKYDVMVELLLEHGAALQNKNGVAICARQNDEVVKILLEEAAENLNR